MDSAAGSAVLPGEIISVEIFCGLRYKARSKLGPLAQLDRAPDYGSGG